MASGSTTASADKGVTMVELSDEDLARFEKEFNRLRSEVYVFRAILGAIMANALASREGANEFFDAIRAQAHTGLTRAFAREQTPQAMRDFQRATLSGFFDQIAEQLDIAQTSQDSAVPS